MTGPNYPDEDAITGTATDGPAPAHVVVPPRPSISDSRTIYVNGGGDDRESGATPDSPKGTLAGAYAALPDRGGRIVIGSGTVRELQPLVATKPILIEGAGSSRGTLAAPTELLYSGTNGIKFAAGSSGSVLRDLTVFADGGRVDGITVQAVVTFLNIFTEGWQSGGCGIKINANGGTANANRSTFISVSSANNSGDGWYIDGNNSQEMTFINCDGTGNAGYGWHVAPAGGLGGAAHNTFINCNAQGNTAGAIEDGANSSFYFAPYVEGSTNATVNLNGNNPVWLGAQYGDPANFTCANPAFVSRAGSQVAVANSTDTSNAATQLNALLAALRTMGIVA